MTIRVALAAALSFSPGSLSAEPSPVASRQPALAVHERSLANGLRVLVHVDRDIPNVALYTVWKVGSRNERPGITGLAHFFEHMMFMGGAQYGKRFDPVMEAAGGANNAYTSHDVTVYQDWFPSERLDLVLGMEADRMRGMVFNPETVESERGVVASERRLNVEEPEEVMREHLWAAAYMAHPYQWSVLGWMVDIENWKQADLEEFFRTHYAPENATLVVAGNVDPEDVFAKVELHMGRIPRGPGRRGIHTTEPEQVGERRISVSHPGAKLPQVMMAWHVPQTDHPDHAALAVIEQLLLGGESSRLYRLLVEDERVALSVSGGLQGHQFDPSLFAIEVKMREGARTAAAERLVYKELGGLASAGPAARELQKAKNILKASFIQRMRTIDGKADLIAETDTFYGGWKKLGDRLAAIEAVTGADVRRLVGGLMTRRNRTTCILEVEP